MTDTPSTPPVPDMATLFCTDPLKLTRSNIDDIILKMREARHLFNTGAPRKTTPKLTKGQSAVKKLNLDIDLGDLKI